MLKTVQELPLEAPDWEAIPRFLATLQQLYEKNQQERRDQRGRLQKALGDLTTPQARAMLGFFDMRDVSQWAADEVSQTHITTAMQSTEQFRSLLLEYYKHDRQPRPATLAEKHLRDQKARELEEEIAKIHERLTDLFIPSSEQPSQPHNGQEHQAEAELPGTPSKARSETSDKPFPLPQPEQVLPQEAAAPSSGTERTPTALQAEKLKPSVAPESASSEPPAEREERPEPGQEERREEEGKNGVPSSQMDENRLEESPPDNLHPSDPNPDQSNKSEISPSDIFLPGTENPNIQAIARQLQTLPDPKNWTELLWTLIAEDTLPTAYWLARAWPVLGQSCPVPPELIAAVQAARQLLPNSQAFVDDLRDIIRDARSFEDEPQRLLGLSAALRASLLAPSTGIQTWLSVPKICPNLAGVVDAVKMFTNWGRSIRPADLFGVADIEQHRASLQEATQAAKRWLEQAPLRRTGYQRASNVWRRMTAPGGAMHAFLFPVTENEQRRLNEVRKNLQQWEKDDYVTTYIQKVARGTQRIDGTALKQIVHNVQEACDLARHWCECVEREQELQSGEDSFSQMTNEVRSQIQGSLPEIIQALQELSSRVQPQPIRATARCLLRSVEQLQNMFNGQSVQSSTRQREWFAENTNSLPTALSRLLLWLPEIPREDSGQPTHTALPRVASALCKAIAEQCSLQAAFDSWLGAQDYRFVETMLDAFDESDHSVKRQAYQEALEGSQEGLRTAISETRAAIEHAEVDGISAGERSEHEGIVEALEPNTILHFGPKHDQLKQISEQMEEVRRVRLKEVQKEWDELKQVLANRIEPAKLEDIGKFVQSSLDRRESRVAEECVAHLTVVEGGGELDEGLFSLPSRREVLEEFRKAAPKFTDSLQRMNLRLVGRNIERGSSVAGIEFREIPRTRRDEAVQAITAWSALKQGGVRGPRISENLPVLLRYLGFRLEPDPSFDDIQRGAEWVHIQARMSASGLTKPIPQFGSQTNGRYDIVCVWERPGADTISAWLRDLRLDTHSVLVFYLGRLTERQRRDYSRRVRSEDLTVAVLDEILLVFLAQERDARLPIFLRCTLPFSAVNPYTPFQAGNVPPEMFFGRSPMVRELQRPSGSCLVYGGRQLGKSALLQHVRREFHHPERQRYAWVEDIKLIGDSVAPETLWGQVRDGLKELKLLPRAITTDKPEEVQRHAREAMAAKAERLVLMLFDEADNFLDADAKGGFQVVEGLRALMQATDRRFKVVFAGLHNVQRFQGIPNQPLAHFGTPLLVGPLEPTVAQQLIREPFEVLGYRFDTPGTVLRILSYTNYHPGLIQLFCDELLKRLRKQRMSPPYPIAQSDAERVYLLPQVRDRIRDRFDWTLALDSRYQAIVWAMILDQTEQSDGYAQAYTPADLSALARGWWPKGFNKADSDQLRGLLDEMTGLGVLVRYATGSYRLRSPNLVRLVGTETDIEDHLLALSEKEPEQRFDADSHHTLLDDQGRSYSPLTYAQGRGLNAARFGVGLVFASETLGLGHIEAAFRSFIPAELPEAKGVCQEIPPTALDSAKLEEWIREYLASHKNHERLILYGSFRGTNTALFESVRAAHKACQAHQRSKKRWLRLLFIFDPGATWNWLSLPGQQRRDIEDQVDAVTFPRRWNLSGLRRRLGQQGKMDSDDVCRAVLENTGGWPYLLDVLFERCGAQNDPRPAAETISEEIADPSSELSRTFRNSLGLHDTARRILKFIEKNGPEVPVELIDPQDIQDSDGLAVLSSDKCDTAIEYLQRLGCIERQDGQLSVEPTLLRFL